MKLVQLRRLCVLVAVCQLPSGCHGVTVKAEVERDGVNGSITFSQSDAESEVTISVDLQGLEGDSVSWAVHELPFPPSSLRPLQLVGPVFAELGLVPLWSINISNISLYGRNSIVGRSLVINYTICANIRPPAEVIPMWAPFRENMVTNGNVFLWQQTIYVLLTTSISSLPWAILSPGSDCTIAPGNIYNPGMVNGACNHSDWSGCAVGDLSGRNGNLTVWEGRVQQLITDPGLQLDTEGLLLAVGEGETDCAPIVTLNPLSASATAGQVTVMLTQQSPLDTTQVKLAGDGEVQIHSLPPSSDCRGLGEIFDPRSGSVHPGSSSLDQFPFGDISRKARDSDMYSDPYLPLSGENSVVGRALVANGTISGCGLLRYAGEVIQIRVDLVLEGFSGVILFSQATDQPLADTIITIETDISAEVELFSPSPIVSSSTVITTLPNITPSLSLTPTPSLTGSLSSSMAELAPETSLPLLLVPYETSSILPSPTPRPSFSPSAAMLLQPYSPSHLPSLSTSVAMVGSQGSRRRRKRDTAAMYNWSLRQRNSDSSDILNCDQLSILGHSGASCSTANPLTCAAGDLSAKHGPLPSGPHSAVLHDPYLPLNSVMDAVLYLEPANGVGDIACVLVTMVTSSTVPSATSIPTPFLSSVRPFTSSSSATPTSPSGETTGGDNDIIIIGAVLGGVVLAALVTTVLVLCVCLCVRRLRSGEVDLSRQHKKNGTDVELCHYYHQQQLKPQIGSDQYHVICSYHPQTADSGDLALEEGEWVTLLEAPLGGQWWRGQASAGEGWFPKSHVKFVDREAERRKAEEDNFKLAAAAIKAASNSFNERHQPLARSKSEGAGRRKTTLSKADIISTPVMTAKFDVAVLDSVVIENQRPLPGSSGSSRPNTPHTLPDSQSLVNHISTEASQSSANSEPAVILEPYLAKYNFSGGTDIELPLRKGEVVSVLEKTESGWWQGVSSGRVGWFPSSYVKPAPARDQPKEEKEQQKKDGGREEVVRGEDLPENMKSETVEATEHRAIHTFSSEREGDLQFTEGDTVLVYWVHEGGWSYGSSGGQHGWFPGTYVELSMSEAGSPLPVSPTDQEEREREPEPAVRGSPSRRSWRKRLSFKRSKSQEEQLERGLVPLLPAAEGETNTKKTQSKPRRKAPPPPAEATSKPDQPSQATPPTTAHSTLSHPSHTTPTSTESASPKQPVARQHKTRKTSSALDPSKPRRLPPVPPTALTTPKTLPTESAKPPVTAEAAPGALAPPSAGATPTAPPRRKIKRVKRPATRLIPPPPTIPLPPPPSRISPGSPRAQTTPPVAESSEVKQKTVTGGEETTVTGGKKETVSGGKEMVTGVEKTVAGDEKKAVKEPSTETVRDTERSSTVKSPKPPPIKPKPSHLSKRVSESQLRRSLSPPTQSSPKPPPPARSSSLHQRTRHRITPTTADPARDDVDSPDSQETADAVRNLRSAPPSHPPPLRPATAGSEGSRSDPPSFPPPQRPSETQPNTVPETSMTTPGETEPPSGMARSNSLKARGSQLMRSLKKMVQKSEAREEGEEPESPTKGQRSKEAEVIQNMDVESPRPQKKGAGLPARPPPPRLSRQTSEERGRVTPARPPPPKRTSTPSLITTNTAKQEPDHTPSSPIVVGNTSPAHSAGSRSVSPQPPSTFYRVKSEYKAQSSEELTLHVGDILVELDRPSPDMCYGMLDDGTTGLFPAAAVEPLPAPSGSNKATPTAES